MKKLNVLLILLSVLFFTNNTYARIWRVNNTPGVNADYTNVQTAVNAVTTLAGDTIHIEPSATSYGALTLNKQVVIIGNGYFLTGSGSNAGLQANTNNSTLGSIDFYTGSDNSSVQGVVVGTIYMEAANILIRRNYITSWFYVYALGNNCTITGNYFDYGFQNGGMPATMTITNNIFGYYASMTLAPTTSGIFENNTCHGGTGVSLSQFQVDNNIFWGTAFTPNNSVYFNNIGDGTQFGNANSNQQNVTPMVNGVFVASGSTDGQYVLKAASPAIGAGYGGVDCGAFGGPNPYKLSGIPNVPTIYSLTVPPTGTTTINVTISTRSNN